MYIPVILGTAREGRQSEKAARYMVEQIHSRNIVSRIVDVRDFRIEATDNSGKQKEAERLRDEITKSDAIIIISPEYNHSFPGELKMMLDMLYKEYYGKHVSVCGVSAGTFGGARAVEQLKLLCVSLGMKPILRSLFFSNISDLFDENGHIRDGKYADRTTGLLDELAGYARKEKK